MTNQDKSARDRQAEQASTDPQIAEHDPPYLVELIDELTAAYPNLTREKAREMLLASGA